MNFLNGSSSYRASTNFIFIFKQGTGKSAAILCSALAWQRYHSKGPNPDTVNASNANSESSDSSPKGLTRIFYCSRTHTQVKQMISTLQNTPYRPTMAILGSRDKLCIHEDLRPRNGSRPSFQSLNVNHECKLRISNTDLYRKACIKRDDDYNDDFPPLSMTGDRYHEEDSTAQVLSDDDAHESERISKAQMCPHYRSLTGPDIAHLASNRFKPMKRNETWNDSVYDIEDLISFGLNPYNQPEKKSYTACPYYLSQALSKDAELVFAPYNYLLDPKIRKAQGIDITGSIVCLDEAHNIEDTLKSAGSGEFQEMELLAMIVLLSRWSQSYTPRRSVGSSHDEDASIPDVSHSLLLFVEKVVHFLLEKKNEFIRSPRGSASAIEEYQKFKLPDDHEFEFVSYAPLGVGSKEPTGSKPFFEQIYNAANSFDEVMCNMEIFEKTARAEMPNSSRGGILDRLVELVTLLCESSKQAE